jgi:hypothetical protein
VLLGVLACSSEARHGPTPCEPPDEPGANVFVSGIEASRGSLCVPRKLVANAGRVGCQVLEAVPAPCDCPASAGLRVAPRSLDVSVRRLLVDENAGDTSGTSCTELCVCELQQLSATALAACQSDPATDAPPGFCYVDPDAGLGSEELVSDCPATSPRKLRFLGSESPANGNRWFLSCLGAG